MNNDKACLHCANTGIVRATLVQKDVDGKLYNVGVNLVLCKDHYDLGETTMSSMEDNTELPLNVVGVQGAV